MLPADDAEAEHAALVVEDLEPLVAAGGSTEQGHARTPSLLSPDLRSPPRELRAELASWNPARAAAPWRPRRGPPAGRAAAPCDGRRSAVLVREEEGRRCRWGRRSAVGVDPRVDWDRSDLNSTAPLLFRVEPLRLTG